MWSRLAFAAVLLVRDPLSAHDMWIEPATFAPEFGRYRWPEAKGWARSAGRPTGTRFPAHQAVHRSGFRWPETSWGRDAGNPAEFVRASDPGVLVVGYYSNPSAVEETAESSISI